MEKSRFLIEFSGLRKIFNFNEIELSTLFLYIIWILAIPFLYPKRVFL